MRGAKDLLLCRERISARRKVFLLLCANKGNLIKSANRINQKNPILTIGFLVTNGAPNLTLREPSNKTLVRRRVTDGVLYLTLDDSREVRTFKYSQTFYSVYEHRRRTIVFGDRPKELGAVETIDQKVLEKHQTYLRRLENFPLKKAAYYRDLQESSGIKSVRGLSELTGEDWSHIARVLKTLELPEPIQRFLNENQQPEVIKRFHLRSLIEIARLNDESSQLAIFREILTSEPPIHTMK